MDKVTRKYTVKDVDMLVSASTILESAIANKRLLQEKRATWADPFFENILTNIDNAIQNYLGLDNAKQLREATKKVIEIQAIALNDLVEAKTQISEDFKKNKPLQTEILNQLGFTNYLANAQKSDQEALINLLYQFKKNLTSELKAQIVAAGTAVTTLDKIVGYADNLTKANVKQEGSKFTRTEMTTEAINVFNDIYDDTISICRISTKFYKDNPAIQQQFSFAKVSKTLNFTKKAVAKATTKQ
ncbi:hypothetical protein [Flavobacterium sp.]|uniref:hypothetical protein n=1 Tax=Flavobacterium sp. TaxID=239 RepID=UPI00286ABA71|nr:hypothetical protein [Flavobacterium sp.]